VSKFQISDEVKLELLNPKLSLHTDAGHATLDSGQIIIGTSDSSSHYLVDHDIWGFALRGGVHWLSFIALCALLASSLAFRLHGTLIYWPSKRWRMKGSNNSNHIATVEPNPLQKIKYCCEYPSLSGI
jgi:hypothetical protein